MIRALFIFAACVFMNVCASAQPARQSAPKSETKAARKAPPAKAEPALAEDISGMYTFLRDGEFVQLDVEEGVVTGFVSRYGNADSDRGAFLDQMFKKASLEGKKLHFETRVVHGVSYEFNGTVERGEGKQAGAEAYFVLKGTLTEKSEDAQQKVTAKERAVEFKSFPSDAMMPK